MQGGVLLLECSRDGLEGAEDKDRRARQFFSRFSSLLTAPTGGSPHIVNSAINQASTSVPELPRGNGSSCRSSVDN